MAGIVMGFGKTETDREQETILEIQQIVTDILKKHDHKEYDFFTDEEQADIIAAVSDLAQKSYKEYDDADGQDTRPERYGRFSVVQAFSGWNYFVRTEWFHINSRHAFSPDGMALLQSVRTESFCANDLVA